MKTKNVLGTYLFLTATLALGACGGGSDSEPADTAAPEAEEAAAPDLASGPIWWRTTNVHHSSLNLLGKSVDSGILVAILRPA